MRGRKCMETFEFDGEKYRKASRHQKEWGRGLITELALKGTESILDLGCGDGVLTRMMADAVPKGNVLGIDASEGMIAEAEKLACGNLEFMHMDINRIDFENEFDVIFSNAALHWVRNHRRLLRAAHRALKLGGVILWDFGSAGNCDNFIGVIHEKMAEEKYRSCFAGFEWPWFMPSRQQYEKMAAHAGFADLTVEEVNRDRYFASAEEMIRWIDQPSIVPFIGCVPDRLKADFRRDVIEEMMRRVLQEDGTCFETFRRLKVRAPDGGLYRQYGDKNGGCAF